ncbi:replication factor A protein 1-like [Silene latifolia]|uniref:replication factor A protein 1-like n=1 Tax=Silene latifolia TaxID=37657 RepID=UPI003D774B3A
MEPTSVKEMVAFKKNYEVTVRVLRKWIRESDVKEGEQRKLYGMEFICIDSQGEIIQATVAKTLVRIFKPLMHEGKIYKISKFVTEQNLGNDRATFHNCRIAMQFTTKVEQVHAQDIPTQACRFVSIEDIIHGNVPNEYYIDVIGLLTQLHEGDERKGYKQKKRRLRLTVWEAYFPEIDRINEACKSLAEKPVLVLKCVQRKEWYGTVTLSTIRGATKFEINPDIPEVEAFKNRIKSISNDAISGPVGESSSKAHNILAGANIKSLASVQKATKAGYYVTLVYIEEMNLSLHWYFNSCGKCLGRVVQEGDQLWYCKKPSCKLHNIGVPTKNPKEGDREAVPLEFRELMEREFIAKIKVDQDYNIQQKSTCYKATQLCGEKDVIKKWKELEESAKENMKTYGEEEQDNTSISKLPQKRSSMEYDECEITEVRKSTPDQGSSSKPVIPLKNIKIEK